MLVAAVLARAISCPRRGTKLTGDELNWLLTSFLKKKKNMYGFYRKYEKIYGTGISLSNASLILLALYTLANSLSTLPYT